MAKPFKEWTVLPHGKLTKLEDNLMTVTGLLRMPPMGEVERRMTVARLSDGRGIVYSAIALDEGQMAALEAFATPSYLIVPSAIHRMDAKIWKDRYPQLKVIAPAAARAKVEDVVAVDATSLELGDPAVRVLTVPGTAEREMALVVEAGDGVTLVLNDLIFNIRNRPGFTGWLFKKIGMTGDEPHMPPVIKRKQVADAGALKAQLESWASMPKLRRVVVAHGPVITDHPERVLDRIASELAA